MYICLINLYKKGNNALFKFINVARYSMKKTLHIILCSSILFIISCGDDPDITSPSTTGTITGYVLNAADSTGIAGANIIVYNANTNSPVTRTSTDNTGLYVIDIDPESYYIKISAQGFYPSPPKEGSALPFQIVLNDTTNKNIYLNADPLSSSTGSISGTIQSPDAAGIGGVLIIATDITNTQSSFSGTTGHDGYYIIFNVKPGTYKIECFLAGYQQDTTSVTVTVTADNLNTGNDIIIQLATNYSLSGQVSFLATSNSQVDITLIHPVTREAIPGLSTFNDTVGSSYSISQVPAGTYIAWASYRNDGYVMDPDALFKFGLPYVTLSAANPDTTVNFKVTGAVQIVSPTNHSDTILPRTITTYTPTFTWIKTSSYASVKEFIVEVFDSQGKSIWGGFDTSGVIRHPQIPDETTQVVFNFDNSASESLIKNEIYRWKIYADDSADPNVQTLLSSSEDLMGLFQVVID